jgi:uncharacterized repeat protein (TIGR04076 family)
MDGRAVAKCSGIGVWLMHELRITVKKVMGRCTADPPMKPGDCFTVTNGDIEIPDGGYICLWALQSLLPLIPAKERELSEKPDEDWMWRVRHAQCPDPNGRVIFRIERVRRLSGSDSAPDAKPAADQQPAGSGFPADEPLKTLRVEVESVAGHCTSQMKTGDSFILRSGRIYIPPGRKVCLYALQAVLPLLPAKQRALRDGDWLKDECRVLCPDPAGNVILRIDEIGGGRADEGVAEKSSLALTDSAENCPGCAGKYSHVGVKSE